MKTKKSLVHLKCRLAIWVAALVHSTGFAAANDLQHQDLFVAGQYGYRSYRIPALLTTQKSTLLAFCEGRKNGPGDSGDIDLLLKRSMDGGQTWSAQQILWDDDTNTCGNPCVVQDQTTGDIFLLATHNPGTATEKQITAKKTQLARTVWVLSSRDDGKTWSSPADITDSVKDPSWGWYATGPGVGIQLQHGPHKGRLIVPCDHTRQDPSSPNDSGFIRGSHIIYSDDHGKSWHLGGLAQPEMNECQVVELADGKGGLMLSMRNYLNQNRRAHALSHDGGAHWDEPVLDSALPDPVCQASILRYSWPKRGSGGQILFANPAGPKREKMTVRLSPDDGQTWPISRLLDPNPGAYSCLAALPDSTIACLYECGEKGPYERIVLARFTLAWLKDSTRNQASFFSRRFSKIELQRCNSARELHT